MLSILVLSSEKPPLLKWWEYVTYPTKVLLYRCNYIYGEIDLNDYSEYIWEDTKNLLNYDLADADIQLAKYVKENIL